MNIHHERAAAAFRNAMQIAEENLRSSQSTTITIALDLAELYLLSHDITKAETELKKVLDLCQEDYQCRAFVLRRLSGIDASLGLFHQAKHEELEAMICEEKIYNI